jgi:hypothetical protein
MVVVVTVSEIFPLDVGVVEMPVEITENPTPVERTEDVLAPVERSSEDPTFSPVVTEIAT